MFFLPSTTLDVVRNVDIRNPQYAFNKFSSLQKDPEKGY